MLLHARKHSASRKKNSDTVGRNEMFLLLKTPAALALEVLHFLYNLLSRRVSAFIRFQKSLLGGATTRRWSTKVN